MRKAKRIMKAKGGWEEGERKRGIGSERKKGRDERMKEREGKRE